MSSFTSIPILQFGTSHRVHCSSGLIHKYFDQFNAKGVDSVCILGVLEEPQSTDETTKIIRGLLEASKNFPLECVPKYEDVENESGRASVWGAGYIVGGDDEDDIGILVISFRWTGADRGSEKCNGVDPKMIMVGLALSLCTHIIYSYNQKGDNILQTLLNGLKSMTKFTHEYRPCTLFIIQRNCMQKPYGQNAGQAALKEMVQNFTERPAILDNRNFSQVLLFLQKVNDTSSVRKWMDGILLNPDEIRSATVPVTKEERNRVQDILSSCQQYIVNKAVDLSYDEVGADVLDGFEDVKAKATGLAECFAKFNFEQQDRLYAFANKSYNEYTFLVEDSVRTEGGSTVPHERFMDIVTTSFTLRCEEDSIMEGVKLDEPKRMLRKYINTYGVLQHNSKDEDASQHFQYIRGWYNKGSKIFQQVKNTMQAKTFEPLEIPDTEDELKELIRRKRSTFNPNIQGYHDASFSGHPALLSAQQAMAKDMSMNTAHILLLGVTGQGKSSTINFLFGKQCCKTGKGTSTTTSVVEYQVHIKKPRILIKNMKLSFIDGPGFGDTEGKDGMNLGCYRKFLDTHPLLKRVKPNIIMIVHNVNDERIGSELHTDSSFILMLKKISGGLHRKIMNQSCSSVILVLTHCEQASERTIQKMITAVKTLSMKYLKISEPPVVAVENCPEEHPQLYIDNYGWYHLKNGDRHPLVLFSTLIEICRKNGDEIGKEAISKYFSQDEKLKPVAVGYKVDRAHAEPYNTTLMKVRNSTIAYALESHFQRLLPTEQEAIGMDTPTAVVPFLANLGILTTADLHGKDIVSILSRYPNQRDGLPQFVATALGAPVELRCIDHKIGSAYYALQDENTGVSVYSLRETEHKSGYQINLPKYVDVYSEPKSFSKCEEFESKKEYEKNRLLDLNVNFGFPVSKLNMKMRSGYNVSKSSGSKSTVQERTMLVEKRFFKVTLNEEAMLSKNFENDVRNLPDTFNANSEDNVYRWEQFIQRYGTHYIATAWAGGSCTLTIKSASETITEKEMVNFMTELQGRLSVIPISGDVAVQHSSGGGTYSSSLDRTITISMEGGDPQFHCTSIQQMTPGRIEQWLNSIESRTLVLTTNLILQPISCAINYCKRSLGSEHDKALRFIFQESASPTSTIRSVNTGSITGSERPELNAISRQDATERTAPNFLQRNWRQFYAWLTSIFANWMA